MWERERERERERVGVLWQVVCWMLYVGGVNKYLSTLWGDITIRILHVILWSICEVREEHHAWLNRIHACTRELYDVFEVQNTLMKCVYCIRQYAVTIHRLVSSVSETLITWSYSWAWPKRRIWWCWKRRCAWCPRFPRTSRSTWNKGTEGKDRFAWTARYRGLNWT